MPGAITVSDREGMSSWTRQVLRRGSSTTSATMKFDTRPGRLEFDHVDDPEDTVARVRVEVPDSVPLDRSQRQLEYVVRSLGCDFDRDRVESTTFDYVPPAPLERGKPHLVEDEVGYLKTLRDYGFEPATYRSMTYEIRGPAVDKLWTTVVEDGTEPLRFLERTLSDGDSSGLYLHEEDNPLKLLSFWSKASEVIRAGRGDLTSETFSWMEAVPDLPAGLIEHDQEWLTVCDQGLPINDL